MPAQAPIDLTPQVATRDDERYERRDRQDVGDAQDRAQAEREIRDHKPKT